MADDRRKVTVEDIDEDEDELNLSSSSSVSTEATENKRARIQTPTGSPRPTPFTGIPGMSYLQLFQFITPYYKHINK